MLRRCLVTRAWWLGRWRTRWVVKDYGDRFWEACEPYVVELLGLPAGIGRTVSAREIIWRPLRELRFRFRDVGTPQGGAAVAADEDYLWRARDGLMFRYHRPALDPRTADFEEGEVALDGEWPMSPSPPGMTAAGGGLYLLQPERRTGPQSVSSSGNVGAIPSQLDSPNEVNTAAWTINGIAVAAVSGGSTSSFAGSGADRTNAAVAALTARLVADSRFGTGWAVTATGTVGTANTRYTLTAPAGSDITEVGGDVATQLQWSVTPTIIAPMLLRFDSGSNGVWGLRPAGDLTLTALPTGFTSPEGVAWYGGKFYVIAQSGAPLRHRVHVFTVASGSSNAVYQPTEGFDVQTAGGTVNQRCGGIAVTATRVYLSNGTSKLTSQDRSGVYQPAEGVTLTGGNIAGLAFWGGLLYGVRANGINVWA